MSVDYSAELYYGYIFPCYDEEDRCLYNYLDMKCSLSDEDITFDLYNSWDPLNNYDDDSDIVIGVKISSTSNYSAVAMDMDSQREYKDKLHKILSLLSVDIKKARNIEPQFFLILKTW